MGFSGIAGRRKCWPRAFRTGCNGFMAGQYGRAGHNVSSRNCHRASTLRFRRLPRRVKQFWLSRRFIFISCAIRCTTEESSRILRWSEMGIATKSILTGSNTRLLEATRIFVLCNPHNPVGRVFTKAELEKIAEICLRHRLIICSDEIHCDLVYPPHRHIPIARSIRKLRHRTVTLMAPSKTYNWPAWNAGMPSSKIRSCARPGRISAMALIPGVNIMGHVAAACRPE